MPFIELLTIGVGSAIAKGILKLWLKDSVIGAEVGTSLVDIIKAKTPDVIAQRRAERQFEQIGEKAAESLAPLFEAEIGQLDEGSLETVAFLVGKTLSEAEVSAEILSEQNLEPSRLTDSILDSVDPTIIKPLSQKELELYKRSIAEASQSIVDIASQLPRFNERTFAEILKRENQLLEIAKQTLEEVRHITEGSKHVNPEAEAARFETAYRLALVRNLDHMELFGIDASTVSRRHSLSVAYVTLSAKLKGSRLLVSVDEALANSHRILLRGLAGSGKTTLLKWVAVRSASRSFDQKLDSWNETLPFFVRLRQFGETRLPSPQDFPRLVAPAISDTMPKDWTHKQLESGRALVLIDGVDEIAESQRQIVRDWLRDLVETYQRARFIVSSRPHAVEDGWMQIVVSSDPHAIEGRGGQKEMFMEADLQPMEMGDIHSFINHWHQAVKEELQEKEEKKEQEFLSENLKKAVEKSRPLRNLAATPLLCAMLCALHRDRRQQLPSDRLELYEAGCQMLLERRDIERRVELRGYPQLTYRQKKSLLQDFAYWLLKNGWSEVSCERVDERLDQKIVKISGLRNGVTGADVRRLLVDRSGLIREPVTGQIDFAHRTFQEFLAAQAILDEGDFGLLVKNAPDDQWREVVILAAGLARPKEREDLIKDIIVSGDEDDSRRHQLHLLAVACLETSVELNREVREKVESRLVRLVPPKDVIEAKDLASAGEFVAPYLIAPKEGLYELSVTIACIRALALIGGETALEVLEGYRNDDRLSVVEELVRTKDSFEKDEYFRKILSDVTSLNFELKSRTIPKFIQALAGLKSLRFSSCKQLIDLSALIGLKRMNSLDLSCCRQLSDLDPLAGLLELELLNLRGGGRLKYLDSLHGLTKLRFLNLRGGEQLTDLSPLANLVCLESLDLSWLKKLTDLSPLAYLSNLRDLNLHACSELTGLEPLAHLVNLNSLDISLCKWIENLEPLAFLTNLKRLNIRGVERVTDLKPLASLTKLDSLDLRGCERITDLSPINGDCEVIL